MRHPHRQADVFYFVNGVRPLLEKLSEFSRKRGLTPFTVSSQFCVSEAVDDPVQPDASIADGAFMRAVHMIIREI